MSTPSRQRNTAPLPDLVRIHRFRRRAGFTLCLGGALASLSTGAWAQSATSSVAPSGSNADTGSIELAPIVVVGTTPLLGIGTPLAQVPLNVQTVRARDLDRQHRNTLTDYLAKNLPSVDVADAQGNPYQVNVNYRGFTASPLLGTPQGISVFVDGVRVNEPFGDVVNWDLLPQQAIDTIQLIPGSNPTYGLNTLGGALSITTKNGRTSPGGTAEVTLGSWGRKTAQIEQGGTIGQNLDYYLTGNVTNDNGWAEQNASRVRQIFGKIRYTDADTTLSLSAGGADNDLHGTQTIPRSFLGNPKQPYTYPDQNLNSAGYVTLSGDHYFNVAIGDGAARAKVVGQIGSRARPLAIISPHAIILEENQIGEGVVLCPNCLVTSNARIGKFFHANPYSSVTHDCVIGDYVTFAPGARCSGHVHIGDYAYIGAGSVIKQGTHEKPLVIGAFAVVGMGAVVTKDVPPGVTVVGNPAHPLSK